MSVFPSEHVYGRSWRERLHDTLRSAPWWALSLIVHLLLLIFVALYTWTIPLPHNEMTVEADLRKTASPPGVFMPPKRPRVVREATRALVIPKERKPELARRKRPHLDGPTRVPRRDDPTIIHIPRPGPPVPVGPPKPETENTKPVKQDDFIPSITLHPVFADRCLVVWLFDESRSMKEQQLLVRRQIERFQEGLRLQYPEHQRANRVRSAVCSFGKNVHVLLRNPTTDVKEIRKAIDKIAIDESGVENVLKALIGVADEFSPYARNFRRTLVIVVVTDEAGNDDDPAKLGPDESPLEQAIARLRKHEAVVLVFGREAGGFGFSGERTHDPTVPKGVDPYAWANRGIESAFPEMLPHDGFFRLVQRVPSGFGPYALQRICRETNGTYFLLRGDEKGYDYEKMLDGYQPEWDARATVASRNAKNSFRRGYMGLIGKWNHLRDEEELQNRFAPADREGLERALKRVDRRLALVESSIAWMKTQGNPVFTHSPRRWQANRDLMWAQLHKHRFQLRQYRMALLALARRDKDLPPPGDLGWALTWWDHLLLRGEKRELDAEIADIKAMYQRVIERHANTPWAEYARREMQSLRGVGIVPWSRATWIERKRREI